MISTLTSAPGPSKFPVVLVLRWLLSAALVALGLWRTSLLAMNWAFFAERVVIDPAYNPVPWLVVELCVVAVGLLLAIRSKWVFAPLLVHIGLFSRQLYVGRGNSGIPAGAYEVWAAEILVFGFCTWLWLRQRLK